MDKNLHGKEFPGGSVVKTLLFSAGGVGSICGWGTKIEHAMWCGQNLKKKKIFFLISKDA